MDVYLNFQYRIILLKTEYYTKVFPKLIGNALNFLLQEIIHVILIKNRNFREELIFQILYKMYDKINYILESMKLILKLNFE